MSREDFEPLVWVRKGISRTEAERWWQGGLSLAEALRWCEKFEPEEAIAWRAAGVTSPAEARAWRVAGVDADEVAGWRDAGIGFAEAAAWREFEYSLEEAKKLKAEGKAPSESFRQRVSLMRSTVQAPTPMLGRGSRYVVPGGKGIRGDIVQRFMQAVGRAQPQIVHSYFTRSWMDDEALAWAERGVDAGDAQVWKELGIAPDEAGRLTKAGETALGTMRAWWEAGIPIDEVAAWLGAGLTPAEAAEHRAKGITAERAAVMRALRDPGE
jgi:hypothetical protein